MNSLGASHSRGSDWIRRLISLLRCWENWKSASMLLLGIEATSVNGTWRLHFACRVFSTLACGYKMTERFTRWRRLQPVNVSLPYEENSCIKLVMRSSSSARGVMFSSSTLQKPCLIADALSPTSVPRPELFPGRSYRCNYRCHFIPVRLVRLPDLHSEKNYPVPPSSPLCLCQPNA